MSTARAALDDLAAEHDATLSVWMGGLDGRVWLQRDADRPHPSASTLKLPLVVAVHQGAERAALSLDERLRVHDQFDSAVPGATFLTTADYDNDPQVWDALGDEVPLAWLVDRAIIRSSNLATNLLIERVGTDAVDAVYRAVGATRSALRRSIQDAPAGEAGRWNETTASDSGHVLLAVADGSLLGPDASQAVESLLARCEDDDALPAGLPAGTYVAHKPGWIDDACHDVALVRPDGEQPFVLSIFTGARLDDTAIHALVAEAARICWDARAALAST